MKKALALLLSVLVLFASLCVPAFAGISIEEGIEALNEQFAYGKGPRISGHSIDYRYYTPDEMQEGEKYPLVVWVHGLGNGLYDGHQLDGSDIANWSSDEYQSRFKGTGAAYIMAVRAPENRGTTWGDNLLEPLKYAIDDFIVKNADTIDTTRVYIGGYSLGGMITLKMGYTYPEMFAALFPICPYIALDEVQAQTISELPVWLTSAQNDPVVDFESATYNWEQITNATSVPSLCRFSTLERALLPNGKNAQTGHASWEAVTADMFSNTNGNYPLMSTVDGNGDKVTLAYPDGMISWVSQFTSEYTVEELDIDEEVETGIIAKLKDFIAGFISKFFAFFAKIGR